MRSKPTADGVIINCLFVAPYIFTVAGKSLENHLTFRSRKIKLVTVTLAPESICALGESRSWGSDKGGDVDVLVVGVVASDEADTLSSDRESVSEE